MTSWVTLADWHRGNGDHMDGGWAFVMGGFMLLVLVAIVLLVIWLLRTWPSRTGSSTGTPTGRESALDILDRRLASGEITPEEYRERAEILRGR